MADREITTVFKADISNFSSSMQDLNRYTSQVNAEFRNATASLGKWSDSADGLQAKITQLNKVLEAEKSKLNSLESAYADLVAQGKENTKEAQNLRTAILNQGAKVKETESKIEHYTESLKELEDAGVETKQELEEVNKKLDEQKNAAKALGGGILKGAAVGIAAIGAAAIGALKGLSSLVEQTKELRTQLGQLETTFEQQGLSVELATKTYDELYKVLGDSAKATEAAQQIAQIATSEEEAIALTNTLAGVYATFGDSLPVEALAETINSTANIGSVQGNLADALEWSGVNLDDFNARLAELSTEEERQALIAETLNGLYGETGQKYKEINADVIAANDAQNKYNQAMAGLAEKVQPAMTSFKLTMVNVLQTIFDKLGEVDLEGIITKIGDAITSITNVVLPPLMGALTWVLDNLNWLAPLLGTIFGLIGSISLAMKIYNGVIAITKTVQLALNAAMKANPIGLIITAIGVLVGVFVTLWNKCEGFRNFWIGLWDGIVAVGKGAVNGIIGIFETALNLIIGFINTITAGLSSLYSWTGAPEIPQIPEVKIPRLAKGGIIDQPTLAMVGEAGKEAVVPLENNTAWIDELAAKLGSQLNGNSQVVNNYSINNKFEKMATTKLALHKSNIELKRLIRG